MFKHIFKKSLFIKNEVDAADDTVVVRKRIENKLKHYQPKAEKAIFEGPNAQNLNIDPNGMVEFC